MCPDTVTCPHPSVSGLKLQAVIIASPSVTRFLPGDQVRGSVSVVTARPRLFWEVLVHVSWGLAVPPVRGGELTPEWGPPGIFLRPRPGA